MSDPALTPAITAALRANELGAASPYRISFACKGSSGASFGAFQGDTAVNPAALATLRRVLAAAAMPTDQAGRILDAVRLPCPTDPLSRADEAAVNAALDAPQGRALVDALDQRSLSVVLADLDLANAAAARGGNSIDPAGQLAICLWCNMSGPPTLLLTWLGGVPVTESGAVVAAPGRPVKLDDIRRYLNCTPFFTAHPNNMAHFLQSVAAGAALLPTPG